MGSGVLRGAEGTAEAREEIDVLQRLREEFATEGDPTGESDERRWISGMPARRKNKTGGVQREERSSRSSTKSNYHERRGRIGTEVRVWESV